MVCLLLHVVRSVAPHLLSASNHLVWLPSRHLKVNFSCCVSALGVVLLGCAGYKEFLMVLGLGTLVSGSDDVP